MKLKIGHTLLGLLAGTLLPAAQKMRLIMDYCCMFNPDSGTTHKLIKDDDEYILLWLGWEIIVTSKNWSKER